MITAFTTIFTATLVAIAAKTTLSSYFIQLLYPRYGDTSCNCNENWMYKKQALVTVPLPEDLGTADLAHYTSTGGCLMGLANASSDQRKTKMRTT
jgi:hypothetical protein